MSPAALAKPETVQTNRTQLRQGQNAILKKAKGRTIVVVKARGREDEKCVLDKRYFDEILESLQSVLETLQITANPRLFNQLLRAGKTIDNDVRSGKLHSFEKAFGDR
jgi:hypothetical protein